MDWIKFLIIIGLISLPILLLWLLNTKKENRYKQLLNIPVFVLIFTILIFLFKYLDEKLFTPILKHFELQNYIIHTSIFLLIFFSVFIFALIKPLLHWVRKYIPLYLAYDKEQSSFTLKNDFLFAGKVIFVSVIIISIISLISFYYLTFYQSAIFYYLFLVLLLSLELFWYINGNRKQLEKVNVDTEDIIDNVIVKNDTNFEKVLSYFRNHKEILNDKKIIKISKIRRSDTKKDIHNSPINHKKGDLIIQTGNYSLLQNELKKKITQIVLNGGNVLIIGPFWNIIFKNNDEELQNPYYKDLEQYFNNLLQGSYKLSDSFDIQLYSSAHGNDKLKKNIVMTSAFDILYFNRFINDNYNWFSNLDLVIFENVLEKIVFSRSAQSSLSIILKSINKKVAFWFLGYSNIGFESAIRTQFLRQGDIDEISYRANLEPLSYLLSLKNENRALQNTLYNLSDKDYMGNESLVIYEAKKLGQKDINWIYSNEQPDADYVEELKKTTVLENVEKIDNSEQSLIQLLDEIENPFFVVNDDKHNLSNILYRLRIPENKKSFYSISSYPYLFRDYMHDNLNYFFEHPLHHIAPQIDQNDDTNSLITLFESLKKYRLKENDILAIFNEQNIDDVIKFIDQKFKDVFKFDEIEKYIKVKTEKDIYNRWKPIKTYYIKSDSNIKLHPIFSFFDIKDGNITNSNSFGRIQKGFAYQYFLRKPLHTYHNKSFILQKIDLKNKIILLRHTQEKIIDKWFASRGIYNISVNKIDRLPSLKIRNKISIRLGLINADFTIKQVGRYDFVGDNEFNYKNAIKIGEDNFKELFDKDDEYEKELTYEHKNRKTLYLSFDITNLLKEKIQGENIDLILGKVSYSLSFLIYEALQTFFSDNIEYIHVIPLNKIPNEYDEMFILPNCNFDESLLEKFDKNSIRLLIIENSPLDIGILEALEDTLINTVLAYIDDYLKWHIYKFETLESSKEQERIFGQINVDEGHIVKGGINKNNEYDDINSFLKCVDNQYPKFFDYLNTKVLLSQLFDKNELTLSRAKYNQIESIEEIIGDNESLPHYCDFCGAEYPFEEMDVIAEDGRERCPVCSENAVDEKEDVLKLHENEIKLFFDYFKLEMPDFDDISINYKNAKDINAHYGKDFIPTRFYDWRVLGFATIKDNKFYIEAENMSPKQNMILTTIHEMVHIWQFLHLDYQKMKDDYDLYLIEGHTTWSEIFYAKEIAKWSKDWENIIVPETRKDEYGDGYRLMKKLLEEAKMDNPFELLLKYYKK